LSFAVYVNRTYIVIGLERRENDDAQRNSIMLLTKILAGILLTAGMRQMAVAGQLEAASSGGTIVHLDGIDMEFAPSGEWVKTYSTYVHPVEFPDRRGIKKAQIIAEEKGKAAIVRFLGQEIQSDRLVQEMESTIAKTKMTKGTGDKDGTAKTAERTMVESVREFTRSYAKGNLKGVTVIETGYDEKKEEAWVKVGFSRTTMRMADQLRGDMTRDQSGTATSGTGQGINPQPSEVRSRKLP
jgi:hypothetical protein